MTFDAHAQVDAAFDAFGEPAFYQADGLDIVVIRRAPDDTVGIGGSRITTSTVVLDVRVSELPDPQLGHVIVLESGERRVIQGTPERLDDWRLVWTLDTRPEK